MAQFGWSVGDIATAIKIISSIVKAFDNAKGAKKQYATSRGFLRQLVLVLGRIEVQIETSEDPQYQADLREHCQAINEAYKSFDEHLQKRYHGLSAQEPSKAKQILATVRWSLEELQEKVQKLQNKISTAMQCYQISIIQGIEAKITDLSVDFRRAAATEEQRDDRYREINDLFLDLKQQNKTISDTTRELKVGQAEEQERQCTNTTAIRNDIAQQRVQHSEETAAIRSDLAAYHKQQSQDTLAVHAQVTEMRSDQQQVNDVTKERLELQERTSARIVRSQKDLVDIIQQQRAHSRSQEEAQRWGKLQVDATEEAVAAEKAHKNVQEGLESGAAALEGVGNLTGNKDISKFAEKAGGVATIYESFKKLTGMFGASSDDSEQKAAANNPGMEPSSTQPSAPQQTPQSRGERRVLKPAPPMPTIRSQSTPWRPMSVLSSTSTEARFHRNGPAVPRSPSIASGSPHTASSLRSTGMAGTRRDSVASAISTTSSLSRPALPVRPQTDGSPIIRKARPSLPPRSSQSSVTLSTLSVANASGRRTSIQSSSVGGSTPQLTLSPVTTASNSSSPTPVEHEARFHACTSPGNVGVEKWIASTTAATIEMDVLDPPASRDGLDSSTMSVSQRRNMFEGSPIMSMGSLRAT